jgi:hypothetical protein
VCGCDEEDKERIQKSGEESVAKCRVPRQGAIYFDVRNMGHKDRDSVEILSGLCPLEGYDIGVAAG